MITNISKVNSTTGSGEISFELTADEDGADEILSVTLDGQKFGKKIRIRKGGTLNDSIQHTTHGQATVCVVAETSNICSADYSFDL